MNYVDRLSPAASCLAVLAALLLALVPMSAEADLADFVEDLARPYGSIGDAFSCNIAAQCTPGAKSMGLAAGVDLNLQPFSALNHSIISDRIVPLSSTVSGFTYDYNEDLDVYERSTSTFGPLFSERAQTLGKGRYLMGLSHSFLEFDEVDGQGLDNISLADFGRTLVELGAAGSRTVTLRDFFGDREFDIDLDLEIREQVSTAYFTYGLTDRIDLGIVVPLLQIEMDGVARLRTADGGKVQDCEVYAGTPQSALPIDCFGGNTDPRARSGAIRDSDSYTGVGDVILRGKWQFMAGPTSAAFLLSASVPTGDEDNLAGLGNFAFTPMVVASRDFETPIGGVGLQVFGGYEFRADDTDKSEIEYGIGASFQPLSRASLSLDLMGTEETGSSDIGGSSLDASVGAKIMLSQGVLLDFNYIAPLNDEGLRPSSGVLSAQLEWVFGD